MGSMSDNRKDIMARLGAIDRMGDRPGAKAKFAAPAGYVARAQADYNRAVKMLEEAEERLDAFLRVGRSDQQIALAEKGVEMARKEVAKAEKQLRQMQASRPGAKARMGQMRDTKGRGPFRLQYIASGLYGEPTWLLVDKAGKTVAQEHNQESADAMLRKANAGEPVYVSSRPGAKAKFGVLDRVGAAYSALTATPADPGSPAYKTSLAAAKKNAAQVVGNYKFMRDKVAARQQSMDKYVQGAIKAINASTNVNDVQHFTEQLEIAVRAMSTILSSVKTPFSRVNAKVTAMRPEDLYDRLNTIITPSNASEMERLALEALKLPKFRKPGYPGTLQGLATQQLREVSRLKARTSPKMNDEAKKRAEDLYDRLNTIVTPSNANEMERLALEALKLPKFKKPGYPGTLQSLASDQIREAKKVKSRASRPGAKVKAGRAEDLYRKLSSGSITYANAKEWERLVTEALRLPDYTPPGGDMSLHEIAEDLGGDLMALKTHSGPTPNAKAKAAKPSDLEREDVKAGLKLMEKADQAVSDKIRTLIAEGKPQDQAVAIALDMKRRGEL